MSKFDRFWELVRSTAAAQGMAFFMDCGEEREFETDEMEGEDISGWLIPASEVSAFEQEWADKDKTRVDDRWFDNIAFAVWALEGEKVTVSFKKY